jgi:hypothetical protein
LVGCEPFAALANGLDRKRESGDSVQTNSRLYSRQKSIVLRQMQAAIGRQLRAELEVIDPVSERVAQLLRELARAPEKAPRPLAHPACRG